MYFSTEREEGVFIFIVCSLNICKYIKGAFTTYFVSHALGDTPRTRQGMPRTPRGELFPLNPQRGAPFGYLCFAIKTDKQERRA